MNVSRRQFWGMLAVGLVGQGTRQQPAPAPLPGAGPTGTLADPDRVGRPLEPITARDNDSGIQAIEKRLQCTCGCGLDIYTCRTTDFSCSFSPQYHKQILSLAASGMTGDEIIAEFVKEHGESILMAPPKRGFALFGYFGPWVAFALAATGMVLLLRRRSRRGGASLAAAGERPVRPAPTAEELALVERELSRFES